MKKCLYYICPTDSIESIIEQTFHQENYFYSSLGNSINFTDNELKETKKLIYLKKIREIVFVLSEDNKIVLDALGNQNFSDIRGLNSFYNQVVGKKKHLEMTWKTLNPQFLILSYFLNQKIKKLENGLNDLIIDPLTITGKIYNKQENVFKDIYSDLILTENIVFN